MGGNSTFGTNQAAPVVSNVGPGSSGIIGANLQINSAGGAGGRNDSFWNNTDNQNGSQFNNGKYDVRFS